LYKCWHPQYFVPRISDTTPSCRAPVPLHTFPRAQSTPTLFPEVPDHFRASFQCWHPSTKSYQDFSLRPRRIAHIVPHSTRHISYTVLWPLYSLSRGSLTMPGLFTKHRLWSSRLDSSTVDQGGKKADSVQRTALFCVMT
jgi:hypothetical protein